MRLVLAVVAAQDEPLHAKPKANRTKLVVHEKPQVVVRREKFRAHARLLPRLATPEYAEPRNAVAE
jgi:hypothetical protein